MKLHANARTCPHSRRLAVRRVLEEGWRLAAAAEAAGVSVRTFRSGWAATARKASGGYSIARLRHARCRLARARSGWR
jgi:hypothetical protein